jgi:hypothetical protein
VGRREFYDSFTGTAFVLALSCVTGFGCGSDASNPDGVNAGAGGALGFGGNAIGGGASTNGGATSSGGVSPGGGAGGAAAGGAAQSGTGGASTSGGATSAGGAGGVATTGLDMHVLFDQTGSMGCQTSGAANRWTVATLGFQRFVDGVRAADLGVGLDLWSFGTSPQACDQAEFSAPDVAIAPLSSNLLPIQGALSAGTPYGPAEHGAAIQAGVAHARAWATAHPTRRVVLVLVVDGMNSTYCNTVDPVPIAAQGFTGSPSIPTYVLGIVDPTAPCAGEMTWTAADFNPIAQAGGTTAAVMADLAGGASAVQAAFDQIRARGGS